MTLLRSLLVFIFITPLAMASPGAHGPNGEHLDAPDDHAHTDAGPRIDAFTESFELVGHLQGGELSVLIDRYETNEPVFNGKLEVEFNGITAPARFHADHGDYSVDDEKFLQAVSKPGKHALIFTLSAGEESDLLEGVLAVPDEDAVHDAGHSRFSAPWLIAAALAIAILLVLVARLRRRNTSTGK